MYIIKPRILAYTHAVTLLLLLGLACPLVCADSLDQNLGWDQVQDSILMPVPNGLDRYDKPHSKLSPKQRLLQKVFGLRMQALHPAVWGIRYKDRTENRNLVPMRPYFLRISERNSFHLSEFEMHFAFEAIGNRRMRHDRTSSTPMIDIGIAGRYLPKSSYELAEVDDEYVIRLTPSPAYRSGIYYRTFNSFTLLEEIGTEVKPGVEHELSVTVKGRTTSISVNGERVASYTAEHSLERGLVQVRTAWHPIDLKKLVVRGSTEVVGKWYSVARSGVVSNG